MTKEEAKKITGNLVNTIFDNCCKVCSCIFGKKVWCACHRKQITEALLDAVKKEREAERDRISKKVDCLYRQFNPKRNKVLMAVHKIIYGKALRGRD